LWWGSGDGNYVFSTTSAMSKAKPHRKLRKKRLNPLKNILT